MVEEGSRGNADLLLAGASPSGTAQISDRNQPGPSRAFNSQGLGLFKSYLTSQLDENGKQLKTQSKIEKEACELKSRENRKQFEFNVSVDVILSDIASKADSQDEVKRLANEGKEKIRKRQKLVKLADRNKVGWRLVHEYESDDLVSNSEDEKKIKKARSAAEKKRKDTRPHGSSGNSFKRSKTSGDNQLFRSKTFPNCLCGACPLLKILC